MSKEPIGTINLYKTFDGIVLRAKTFSSNLRTEDHSGVRQYERDTLLYINDFTLQSSRGSVDTSGEETTQAKEA